MKTTPMPAHPVQHETNRRKFLGGLVAVTSGAIGASRILASDTPAGPAKAFDWSAVRGFNYQPSYGTSGFDLWQRFDAKTIELELGRGKKYFPGINAIRFWLSRDSFVRNPRQFSDNFETSLTIAAKFGLVVMPVLFNRWHDQVLDYGGIYIDHFLPGSGWVYNPNLFDSYLTAIVGGHKSDPRIFAWDLCNEPFPSESFPEIAKAEFNWLKGVYDHCKRLGASAPITVGIHPGTPLPKIEPITDILSIHPYWTGGDDNARAAYEKKLDVEVAFAQSVKKPLLPTECCWGAFDDARRVEFIRYTLTQLRKRKLGWLAYLLHHSLIADAHRPEFGPVGGPENLAFIEADGSLRKGHEVFNEF
jgi:hypothetical protein